eukprot:TRINITY_DN2730_c0_g1_i1.p2 TRINITY_DN2730_c0_g1~~TRINITY_DN2730_c0_g1_i1.p2  ORF type:complete len:296 (-),score=69.31 TRINITY_DN2730_c0_g1_i1:1187-2074(-)
MNSSNSSYIPNNISGLENNPEEFESEDFEERIVLNVGGFRYEVLKGTLTRYPNTLLGELFSGSNIKKRNEYFFDRNGRIFEIILNYYRTGKLVIPQDMPAELVREELNYFRIEYIEENEDNEHDKVKVLTPEEEDEIIKQLSIEVRFQKAWEFVHGDSRQGIKRGVKHFTDIIEAEQNNVDAYYYRAFGYCRLSDIANSYLDLDKVVSLDPQSKAASDLKVLIDDKKTMTKFFGITTVVAILGAGIFAALRMRNTLPATDSPIYVYDYFSNYSFNGDVLLDWTKYAFPIFFFFFI